MTKRNGSHQFQHHLETILDKQTGMWKDFSESIGLHAVNKITFEGTIYSKARSILWAIVWMASAITLTYFIVVEIENYYSYPTTSNTFIRLDNELKFPAVTICNLSPYNKSAFSNDTKTQNLFLSFSATSTLAESVNWSDPFYAENGYKNPKTLFDIISHTKDLSTSIKFAVFDNELQGNQFTQVYTDMGLCLRFNSNGTIRTSMFGAMYNLFFYFDVKTFDDYFSNYLSSGIKIAIHDPLVEPIMANEGLVIPPTTDAYIEIQKQEYKFLPQPYKAFGNKTCEDRQNYRKTNCLRSCWNDIIKRECNCTDFLSEGGDTFCSYHDFHTCSNPLFGYLIRTYNTSSCDCPQECFYELYTNSFSAGKFPSDLSSDFLTTAFNIDRVYFETQYCTVRVYFKDLSTTVTEQLPKYDHKGVILANLGGQLGLFLGASILSMTEIIEFIMYLLYSMFKRIHSRDQVKDNSRKTVFKQ